MNFRTFILFTLLVCCAVKSADAAVFQQHGTRADTTKKQRPPQTNAGCNVIATLIGTSCIGSTLSIQATDPIATVEWIYEGSTLTTQNTVTNGTFSIVADRTGSYSARIVTTGGCNVNTTNSIIVTDLQVPTVTITTRSNIICASFPDPVFTGVGANNGDHPTYQWKINGAAAGPQMKDNLLPFPPKGLKKGDVITCDMVSTATCITTPYATSNSIVIDDIPVEQPTITLSLETANPCPGKPLTFKSHVTDGGTAPKYQWYLNDNAIAGATADSYTSALLKENDRLACEVISNEQVCLVTPVAKSDDYVIRLNPLVTPAVSISADATTANAGTPVTFTATATYAGPKPLYRWRVNGAEVPSDGTSTFVSTTLQDNDVVSCVLISDEDCTSSNTAVSGSVQVHIIVPVRVMVPSVFTPNNDGQNDTWKITGVEAYPNLKVDVFNRNGQQVYRSAGNARAWAGEDAAGHKCAPGVYFYIINLDAQKVLSGSVTLLR